MAISHYVVFVPADGTPLTGDGNTVAGLVDPLGRTTSTRTPSSRSTRRRRTSNKTLEHRVAVDRGSAGKIVFNPFSITRKIDALSPTLFHNAAAGVAFETVDLIEHRAGKDGDRAAFVAWQFKLVAVRGAWASGDDRPSETVTSSTAG